MANGGPASRLVGGEGDSLCGEDVRVVREGVWGEEGEGEVVMCAVWGGGMLGACYYCVATAMLHVMADIAESEDFAIFSRLLLETQPSVVVVSSKSDDRMQKTLQDYAQPPAPSQSCEKPMTTIEVLPSSEFRLDPCRRRILSSSNLPGVSGDFTEEERMIRISALLPLESANLVRSLGVLLKYVDRKRLGMELEEDGAHVSIVGVKTFSLENLMVIDETTYCALQIFQKEIHPSVYKTGKGTKEGLSLFGIVNNTKSALGSKMLRLWFLRPLRDITVLRQRQSAIAFLSSAKHEEVASTLHDCVKHIRNLPRVLKRMNAAQATMTDWHALYKTAYNGIYIGDICRSLPKEIAIFSLVAERFSEDLHRIASLINRIVDFDESGTQQRFCVKYNIDPELDQKKAVYHGLPDLMTRVAREELERLGDDITECNLVYLPQLGYLLAIPRGEVEGKEEEMKEKGMEFVFISKAMAHFKSDKTRELDTILGDTQCEIQDHETAIMHRLQSVVLEHADALLSVMELSAELDCLLSLAQFAKEHNCVCPELSTDTVLYIKAGRHPLQELCVSQFVSNDACMDLDHGRMKVLTGPNASGKSVYLKQVGLIVFLAHIGSFVPAEGAKVGVVDRVFSRIQTRESVSVPLSTFMIDLNQVSVALRESTEKSLIILDEFGKGTATVDGVSLLVASLRHWLSWEQHCPRVLISTHFHSVIQQRLLPSTQLVEYLTMDCLREGAELVFLYQLVRGQTDSSYACHVAAMMGLPAELVHRGAEVSDLICRNEPVNRLDSAGAEEWQKRCAAIVASFLELDLDGEAPAVSAFLRNTVLPHAEGVV